MSSIQIVAQPTPNPNSVKFTLDRTVSEGTSQTYQNAQEAEESPLATAIFAVPGVTMVFLLNNFVTVGKDPSAAWHDIVPQVEEAIRRHFAGN
ncbi:MAG TPA: NifU N-terminal domain-containing protein [Bacillota bacterium]